MTGGGSLDPALVLRHRPRDGCDQGTATIAGFFADALSVAGRSAEAVETSLLAERHAPESDVVVQVLWRMARARALAEQDPTTADALARDALTRARDTDWPDLEARALACVAHVVGPGDEQSSSSREPAGVGAERERCGGGPAAHRFRSSGLGFADPANRKERAAMAKTYEGRHSDGFRDATAAAVEDYHRRKALGKARHAPCRGDESHGDEPGSRLPRGARPER